MKIIVFTICLMLLLVASPGQDTQILQIYRNIIAQASNGPLSKSDDIFNKINENTVGALTEDEVAAVIPFSLQCIRSSDPEVRKDGFLLLIAVSFRPDSAKLLAPSVDDLGSILGSKDAAPRQTIFFLMGSMKPQPTDKALAYLEDNLSNRLNSDKEMTIVAASLLNAKPADASTIHKVLLMASTRADSAIMNAVIRQIGQSRIRVPEAIEFISSNLNQTDQHLRASAVDAVSRMDKNERASFGSQLRRIASDPRESREVREQATEALRP